MPLPWLDPDTPFPPVEQSWGADSDAPGLLAAGADLSPSRLVNAYQHGIFPWFSQGQPVLWWSTDPRMVLKIEDFRIRTSFGKVLRRFAQDSTCEIRIDHAFDDVIGNCAKAPRNGQSGTWIVEAMQQAYTELHKAGYAHSVENWRNGQLVGGLYCVAIGKAVFGESMFARESDASKIALAALVSLCRNQGVKWIDCQQNTRHLASLGARVIPRADFVQTVRTQSCEPPMDWTWKPLYWDNMGFM